MTRRRKLLTPLRGAAAAACAVALFATTAMGAPSIEVLPSATELTIGDRVELLVTVRVDDAGARHHVRFQPWGETLGTAEILAVAPIEELPGPDDSVLYRQRLVLTLFRLGEVILPPVEATVIGGDSDETPLTSASTTLTVRSVLPEVAEEIAAAPPAPPRRPALGRPFWWSAAALALTCLVALVALKRVSGDEADADGRPRLAPMEELRRTLVALRTETEPVPLHTELSQALRRYLGRSLSFQALESTTTEVRRELCGRQLPADVVRQTGDLLSACDMVKFARQSIDLSAAQARIGTAEAIAGSVASTIAAAEAESAELSGEPA